jgi:hypothetical protein
MSEIKRKTPKEHAEDQGKHCPVCGSDNISQGDLEDDGNGKIYSNGWCCDCPAEWTDEYSLSGYSQLLIDGVSK